MVALSWAIAGRSPMPSLHSYGSCDSRSTFWFCEPPCEIVVLYSGAPGRRRRHKRPKTRQACHLVKLPTFLVEANPRATFLSVVILAKCWLQAVAWASVERLRRSPMRSALATSSGQLDGAMA